MKDFLSNKELLVGISIAAGLGAVLFLGGYTAARKIVARDDYTKKMTIFIMYCFFVCLFVAIVTFVLSKI